MIYRGYDFKYLDGGIIHEFTRERGKTIGALRNAAIQNIMDSMLGKDVDMIAHFDDDDWSCPTRLAEQVAFLQASGKDVVGYSDMAFYDVTKDKVTLYTSHDQKYVLGTSLLYRRALWESLPFPDMNDEDVAWLRQVGAARIGRQPSVFMGVVRMVATIHKGNTSAKKGARYQKASPELDAAVRACIGRGLVAQ
jgi:glycosyltransferase involved in cell wall biosynthesis